MAGYLSDVLGLPEELLKENGWCFDKVSVDPILFFGISVDFLTKECLGNVSKLSIFAYLEPWNLANFVMDSILCMLWPISWNKLRTSCTLMSKGFASGGLA